MSRLRRLVVSDRWFFITCRLLRRRRILSPLEFTTLASVIDERRAEHGFLLTAWVFLPDHWHAIFYPPHPLTISRVMEATKDAATKRINRSRREAGVLWQPRFFDRALRTVKEYNEKVQYYSPQPGQRRTGEPCGRLAVVERARLHWKCKPGAPDSKRISREPRVAACW